MGQGLLSQAEGLLPGVIELRRTLHAHPELGCDLPRTREAVLESLEGLPLEIWQSQVNSGVVATLRGGAPGPTLLLRGDMDALPMTEDTGLAFSSKVAGAMHACGHDAHTAMLVGAVRLLVERRQELHGNLRFMFQPGEEGHFGARQMVEEGMLEQDPVVDAAFAMHVSPLSPVGTVLARPGPMLASADTFHITLTGEGGHASMPHLSLDPIPAACEIVTALQALVTRRVNAHDPGVLTVARIEAGTTSNVIPERALLEGTIRSFSARTRTDLVEGLRRVAGGVAAAHGLRADVEISEGYPVVLNHPDFTAFMRETATELLGPERVPELQWPLMGAEDFSYVLQRVPGTFAFLGMRPEGDSRAENIHSNRMLLNEQGMAIGVALHAALALRYLDGTRRDFAPPDP